MRTLRIDDRPTKLAQTVAELGRIEKTVHSLTYIDDESKRRRTLTQLNRGEDRHKLARAVLHGKRGAGRQCGVNEDADGMSDRHQRALSVPGGKSPEPIS